MNEVKVFSEIAAQLGAGAAFLLIIAIVALQREWVVPGSAFRRHVQECNAHIRRLQMRLDRREGFIDETLALGEEGAELLSELRRARREE